MARKKTSPWGFVGMGGLACLLFLDIGTAAIAPWWVTTLLLLLWLVLSFLGAASWETRPRRVTWLAGFGFVVWLVTIVVGTSQLGWR